MTEFSVMTYNVAGLPSTLDLNDLPWILKPIAWIYKLIKGTTLITVNDRKTDRNKIADYLSKSGCDIIGVQEDFSNQQADGYSKGTDRGGFNLKKLFSSITWLPLAFKADGINIFYNSRIKVNSEKIIWWNESNGYISHANDTLTHKGFRHYNLTIDNEYGLDLYIVHMDADFYHPINCPDIEDDVKARRSQLEQLANFINDNKYSRNPILIIGDTNSGDYTWDIDNFNYFRFVLGKPLYEVLPNSTVDRMFVINNTNSKYKLCCTYQEIDNNMKETDHRPFIVKFKMYE